MNRRDFIKKAAIGTIGVASIGLVKSQTTETTKQPIKQKPISRHLAKIEMTIELALELFGHHMPTPEQATLAFRVLFFPEGTEVVDISQSQNDMLRGIISLIVSHPDLPYVSEGCTPMIICPIFRKDFSIVRFDDWGI